MERIAIYAGSFDPFTNGHLDVVIKGSRLFDKVLIVVAYNSTKHRAYIAQWMRNRINEVLKNRNLTNCFAFSYEGLIADFAKENNANYIIRGIRNSLDFGYEEGIAEANKLIYPELETIYFRANNSGISSSMVRDLIKYGKDVSEFVPEEILSKIIEPTNIQKINARWKGEGFGDYRCSYCDEVVSSKLDECPNCGANMRN